MPIRIVLPVLLSIGATAMAAPPPELAAAIQIAHEQDTFAAFAKLESRGEPVTIAGLYSQSVFVLYGEKDVPRMIAFGRAGIQFCLAKAEVAETEEAAAKLRGIAKTISYNVGSNCWPGWRDDGIVLEATDVAIGLDLARLNLRLAGELGRPTDKQAAAQWLLGAQLLANEKPDEASDAFVAAARLDAEAGKPVEKLMNLGYAALAEMTVPATRKTATGMFEASVKDLREEGSDDAKFYADQLETARSVFVDDE